LSITLTILNRHVKDQHFSGRLGKLTQTGVVVISMGAKSKYSSMGFKTSGLLKTKYDPPYKTASLSSSKSNLKISHLESCMIKEAAYFQVVAIRLVNAL
jgi:hypothetical protein